MRLSFQVPWFLAMAGQGQNGSEQDKLEDKVETHRKSGREAEHADF